MESERNEVGLPSSTFPNPLPLFPNSTFQPLTPFPFHLPQMAMVENLLPGDGKLCGLIKLPFCNSHSPTSPSSSTAPLINYDYHQFYNTTNSQLQESASGNNNRTFGSFTSVSSVARSFIPLRRRLKLQPTNTIFFPYEPGKQVRSAVKIINRTKCHVAFKFQSNAPKSCFMSPPAGILAPGASTIASVVKFVAPLEKNGKLPDEESNVKLKIVSLKVKGPIDYGPELFDEHKDQVVVEQILRVVFLDVERPSSALWNVKSLLAEAEVEAAAREARRKPPENTGHEFVGEGVVIDEWKKRRERYLAQQQTDRPQSV